MHIYITDDCVQHPLRTQAMLLAKNSVMKSSQKSYGSTWNKWEKFSSKYFPPIWTDETFITVDYDTLLDRLLMFVTYCAQELKCNVRSIPSIMSALRHGMVSRLVKCCNAFDNELLKSVKQGIAHMSAPVHRSISSMHQVMLATGVYVAFFLCLRSSEYVSKTVVPLADTHLFMSTDVQFVLNDPQFTLINSNQIGTYAYEDLKTVKFSLLYAKNIRNDFGVPIWFSTHDKTHSSNTVCTFDISMVEAFIETRCRSISILPCAGSFILFIAFAYTSGSQVVRRSLWIKRRMVQYALNQIVRADNSTRYQSVSS